MPEIRAPLVLGALISGTLALIALGEALLSRPRWDDHLINAVAVLGVALFVSLTLRLATAAFRTPPDAPKRHKLIRAASFVALALLVSIVIGVAVFLNNRSFL